MLIMIELSIIQHVGAAPFPWHRPCSGSELGHPPINVSESPWSVRWKNLICWMGESMVLMGSSLPPIARRRRNMTIWLIWSLHLSASADTATSQNCCDKSILSQLSNLESSALLLFLLYWSSGIYFILYRSLTVTWQNSHLLKKLKSPSIKRMTRSFSTRTTPGTFSSSTWRPFPQRLGGTPVCAIRLSWEQATLLNSGERHQAFLWPKPILDKAKECAHLFRPSKTYRLLAWLPSVHERDGGASIIVAFL